MQLISLKENFTFKFGVIKMTRQEYFSILSEEIKKVNFNSKESIKRYNELKANLRSQLEFEED